MRYVYAANSLCISHRNNYTTLKNPGFDQIQCYYAHENPSNINRIMDLKLQEHFKCLFFDTYARTKSLGNAFASSTTEAPGHQDSAALIKDVTKCLSPQLR